MAILGKLVAQGVSKLGLTEDVPMPGVDRSGVVFALNNHAEVDAKRRCLEGKPALLSMVVNQVPWAGVAPGFSRRRSHVPFSHIGHRCMRVGEASRSQVEEKTWSCWVIKVRHRGWPGIYSVSKWIECKQSVCFVGFERARGQEQTIEEVWSWEWRPTLWTPQQLFCRMSWMVTIYQLARQYQCLTPWSPTLVLSTFEVGFTFPARCDRHSPEACVFSFQIASIVFASSRAVSGRFGSRQDADNPRGATNWGVFVRPNSGRDVIARIGDFQGPTWMEKNPCRASSNWCRPRVTTPFVEVIESEREFVRCKNHRVRWWRIRVLESGAEFSLFHSSGFTHGTTVVHNQEPRDKWKTTTGHPQSRQALERFGGSQLTRATQRMLQVADHQLEMESRRPKGGEHQRHRTRTPTFADDVAPSTQCAGGTTAKMVSDERAFDVGRSQQSPPNVEDLGEQVWSCEGIKVLSTPVGTDVGWGDEESVRGEHVMGGCPICRLVGRISSNVQAYVATTCWEHCPRANPGVRSSARWKDDASDGFSNGRVAPRTTSERRRLSLRHFLMRMGGLGLRFATRMAGEAPCSGAVCGVSRLLGWIKDGHGLVGRPRWAAL